VEWADDGAMLSSLSASQSSGKLWVSRLLGRSVRQWKLREAKPDRHSGFQGVGTLSRSACDNSITLDLKMKPSSTLFNVTVTSESDPGFMKATLSDVLAYLYASDLSGNILGYDLNHMRLHAPSEHTIESQRYAIEVQLFFKLRDEFNPNTIQRAAMSLLFKESSDKQIAIPLLSMLTNVTSLTNQNVTDMVTSILPSPLSYFTYLGSDTVPNCEENMVWYIVETPIDVSSSQVAAFNAMYSGNSNFAGGAGNNRNIQSLNNRTIKKGGVQCEEQFIYFFSFVLLYAFINYFIFKLL
jgi:carbonic anhydrase